MPLASAIPITSAGTLLPIRISMGDKGETRSWSNVPISRSRATDIPVIISPMRVVRMATSAGTVLHCASRLGLNQTRETTSLAGGGPTRRAASSAS